MAARCTLLLDNGSLAPAATLGLRRLAQALAGKIGEPVHPVSLLHSSGVPAEKLDGQPAEIFEPALQRRLAARQAEFLVVPLFFGPSGALTEYLPERVARLKQQHPTLRARLAPPLFAPDDDRLARILEDNVRTVLTAGFARGEAVRVALVDHGSPARAVTEVRNQLAAQLAARLGRDVAAVAPCSMERRPEPAFDFNEPLLEKLLVTPPWNAGPVVVAMQFLLPGRHAGPDGDVAQICRRAEAAHPRLRTRLTGLVGEHPLLVDILADRWRAGLSANPI